MAGEAIKYNFQFLFFLCQADTFPEYIETRYITVIFRESDPARSASLECLLARAQF